jgi:DNA mismatch repair protein MutH
MTVPFVAPPQSEEELLSRCQALAGLTIGQLAERVRWAPPKDLRRNKGWVGELLETALGATAASLPEPDFPHLGVEMKTIPVDGNGRPRESTHVCTVPLVDNIGLVWEDSLVRRKLARVLWLPVEAAPDLPLTERRIGAALLWSPTPEQEAALKADFEELMDMVCLGQLEKITARYGTWLQIRPKAADSRAVTEGIGPSGETVLTLPRGFYLRATFTTELLRQHYALP